MHSARDNHTLLHNRLETEGYDVSAWRSYNPPPIPIWVRMIPGINQQWDPTITKGCTLEFTVDKLQDENGSNSWYWEATNVTLNQGDTMKITWLEYPPYTDILGMGRTQINYPINVSIGGKILDNERALQFAWFVLPLITTDGFGELESGIRAAERYFRYSFPLSNESKNSWYFSAEDDPSLYNTGGSVALQYEILAYITTAEWGNMFVTEDRVFNLTYNAQSGILKHLLFTNTVGGEPSTGTTDSFIVKGLKQLEINFKEPPVPTTPTTTAPTTEPSSPETTSSFEEIFVLSSLVTIVVIIRFESYYWKKSR